MPQETSREVKGRATEQEQESRRTVVKSAVRVVEVANTMVTTINRLLNAFQDTHKSLFEEK